MRNRFVFTSSALLVALHAFGCGASPEGDTTTPTGVGDGAAGEGVAAAARLEGPRARKPPA
ncbi:hypothetical protein, partial [Corallococcus exiguus]|uniref:hypothetical protein n=1 Tax=Corallococcus exiguus TaxID=83462 RepID=UPI001C12FE16